MRADIKDAVDGQLAEEGEEVSGQRVHGGERDDIESEDPEAAPHDVLERSHVSLSAPRATMTRLSPCPIPVASFARQKTRLAFQFDPGA